MINVLAVVLLLSLGVNFNVAADYDKDCIEYDDAGLKQVNCIRCNIVVKERSVKVHTLSSGEKVGVYFIKTLDNFSPVPYDLSNGSYTNLMMCKDCERGHVDTEKEREGMSNQLRNGWALEAKGLKRSEEEVAFIEKEVVVMRVVGRHKFGEAQK